VPNEVKSAVACGAEYLRSKLRLLFDYLEIKMLILTTLFFQVQKN